MTRLRAAVRALLAGSILLAAAACSDVSDPIAPASPDDPTLRQTGAQEPAGDPISLGRGVRGFGGFFLDEQGAATVWLMDPAERGAAERALAPYLAQRGIAPSDLRVLRGDFSYNQLDAWFEAASAEVLAVQGAVFIDADERRNRVRIGVTDAAAAGGVQSALATLRIPAAAVVVEETAPIQLVASLQDWVRPVVAGLNIDFILGLCSLGFNATRLGRNSWVTASHCSWTQGGTEGTYYYQSTWFDLSGNDPFIGNEVDDPVYFKSGRGRPRGCPKNRVCRYSDALRAEYPAGFTAFSLGEIARTAAPNLGSPSLEIVGSFQITGEYGSRIFGINSEVSKVGRTTGWTRARVTETDVNVNISGTNITQLGQTLASGGSTVVVGAGDSGSGMFVEIPGGGTTVTLAGILWGGSPDGTLLAFSPLVNVQQELGDLEVVQPPQP